MRHSKQFVARCRGKFAHIYFRADAGFANPDVYGYLEAEGIKYAIRLPANRVLRDRTCYLDNTLSASRNPLYVFSLIATFGAGLQTGSLLFAILTAFGVWIILDATVRKEEVALRGRFGDAYEVYCARTPRYVPKITSWQGQDSVTVNMHLLYRTLLDGSLFFLIVPVAELIDRLQVVGYFPVLLKLPF